MKTFRLVLCFFVLFGCRGKARSDQQDQGEIPFPQNPAVSSPHDRFGLAGDDGHDSFEGSTVLFDAHPSADSLSHLLVTSRDFRTARGDYFQFLKVGKPAALQSLDSLQKSVDDREKQLGTTKREEQTQAYFGDKSTAQYAERVTAAQAIATQIMGHKNSAGEVDLLPAFGAYCDAKILELAVSATLYHETFLKRPTPHILCEAYYAGTFANLHDQPYFQGDTCQDEYIAKNGAAACIWEQGVFQTNWFRLAPKACGAAKTAAECFTAKFRTSGFDIFQAYARTDLPLNVRKAMLRGANAPAVSLTGIDVPAVNFNFINLTVATHKKPPTLIISAMQRKFGSNESGPFPDDVLNLQKLISVLGERLETDGAEGGDFTSSESDFHFFVTSNPLLREVKHDDFFETGGLSAALNEAHALLMPKNNDRSEALKKDLSDAQNKVLADRAKLEETERNQDTNLRQKVQAAIQSANEPGLSRAFWDTFRISVDRKGSVVRVQLLLREPAQDESVATVQGCVDVSTETSVLCGTVFSDKPKTGDMWLDALTLTHNPQTGLLTLTHEVNDAAALGWKIIPRVTTPEKSYFQEVPLETLSHTTWEWKIFPGRLESNMAILTGDLTIRRGEETPIEGSFSWYQRTAD